MATYIGANSNVFGMVKSILNIWAIRNQASAGMQKKVQRLSKATKYNLVNVTIFNRISYIYIDEASRVGEIRSVLYLLYR